MTERAAAERPIIEAVGVSRTYRLPRTRVFGPRERLTAIEHVDFAIRRGEAVGIVGETGTGKSTLMKILVGADRPTSGQLRFDGTDLWAGGRGVLRRFRRDVQMIMQNPRSSFDRRMTVGAALLEPIRALRLDVDPASRVREVLDQVGMSTTVLRRYPHEFSGGQLQRIAIARALIPAPRVLIADEPVSALDVSIQAQVLNLLQDLVADLGLALVLVAHDLSVVSYSTSRAAVLAGGYVVEEGDPAELFFHPQADETKRLVDAVLTVAAGLEGRALSDTQS